MGFLSKIVGGSIGEAADGIAGAIDRFVETGEEKRAAERLIAKIRQEPLKWQAEINKIQAKHRSVFVAGARPFVLWVCGFAFAYHYVAQPFLYMIFSVFEITPELVTLDIASLITVLVGLLGLSGVRTYEKKKGLTR